MQLQFSHVMLYVRDMERAVRWYQGVLGFTIRFLGAPHYATLWHESMKVRFDLHGDSHGGNIGRGPIPHFAADDLDAAVAFLRAKGVTVSDPRSVEGSPRFTEFADSEGNVLGIYEASLTT